MIKVTDSIDGAIKKHVNIKICFVYAVYGCTAIFNYLTCKESGKYNVFTLNYP